MGYKCSGCGAYWSDGNVCCWCERPAEHFRAIETSPPPVRAERKEKTKVYSLLVNRTENRKEQIERCRGLGLVDGSINEKNFPRKKSGIHYIKSELFYPNRSVMRGAEVLESIKQQGFRPTTLSEFLGFVVMYPEELKDKIITELGSVWKYNTREWVVYSWYDNATHKYNLAIESYIKAYYYEDTDAFLVVRL